MKHKEIKEYKNMIINIAMNGDSFAVLKNSNFPVPCSQTNCCNCLFYDETHCFIGRKKWLNSEYEKEKVVQSNYDKIIKALNNMSIDEFANTRIFYYDRTGFYYGDFGAEDDRETAIKREIEWLKKEAKQ